jgi:hypothetical protein
MLVCGALVAGLFAAGGCGGGVEAPASFASYNAKDGSFACEYPDGWETAGGGKGHQWAKFTSGSAEIKVQTNITGSLMGDIAQARNQSAGIDQADEELAPVARVHQMEKEGFAEEIGGCEEQAPVVIKTGLGDARRSEFTTSGAFGGTIRGYRATMLSLDKRVRVVCQCSESDWENLQPAFDRVIVSVGPGTPPR